LIIIKIKRSPLFFWNRNESEELSSVI